MKLIELKNYGTIVSLMSSDRISNKNSLCGIGKLL